MGLATSECGHPNRDRRRLDLGQSGSDEQVQDVLRSVDTDAVKLGKYSFDRLDIGPLPSSIGRIDAFKNLLLAVRAVKLVPLELSPGFADARYSLVDELANFLIIMIFGAFLVKCRRMVFMLFGHFDFFLKTSIEL